LRRILVTNGCGLIGLQFIRHELAAYQTLSTLNANKLTYAGNPESLTDLAEDSRREFAHPDSAPARSPAQK
jgi:dTDP-glucose 4,6-dehydratase